MDRIIAYRLRRNRRLAKRGIRMDADEEGRWVTTENGHRVHFTDGGEIDKGNPHVVSKMRGGAPSGKSETGVREAYRQYVRDASTRGVDSDEAQEALGKMMDSHFGESEFDRMESQKAAIREHIDSEVDFSDINEDDLDYEAEKAAKGIRKAWRDDYKAGIASTLGMDKLPEDVSKAIDEYFDWNGFDISDDAVIDAYREAYEEYKAGEEEREYGRRYY